METFSVILGITAALLHGSGYLIYNIQTKLGKSEPRIITWLIWVFLTILNALSYNVMSGDFVAALQFFMGSVACIATFLYVIMIGKFKKPEKHDWLMFGLAALAMAIWVIFRSATGANMIILLATAISFMPTLKGVWKNPFVETPLAWNLWTIAYAISTTNLLLRDCPAVAFIGPVAMIFAHGAIAVLSTESRKRRFSKN